MGNLESPKMKLLLLVALAAAAVMAEPEADASPESYYYGYYGYPAYRGYYGWGGYYGYPYRYWKRDAEAAPAAAADPSPESWYYDTMDIPTDTGVMDTVDTTDTLTDTGGRDLPKNNNQNLNILSNDPLMLTLMPMPAPNPGTMDTTAIPTDGAVTTEDIMDTVIPDTTGVRIISS